MSRICRLPFAMALILVLGSTAHVAAEAVLDGSARSTGSFSGTDDFEIPHTVGRLEGGNLFHSFERFHVRRGESATFTGPSGIDNVITRMTGDEISRINGPLISEVAGADFFFLNPNGVFFGPRRLARHRRLLPRLNRGRTPLHRRRPSQRPRSFDQLFHHRRPRGVRIPQR